ncbi:MAG TPA: hypothetical protein P5048_05055, partial [Chlamydiales bacterium]|nr:hypothetical protein [Chlamydiales bacterium]
YLFSTSFESEIGIIQRERNEVWQNFINAVQKEDLQRFSEKDFVTVTLDNHQSIQISQEFARKLLSIDSFGNLRRVDQNHRGHHPTLRLGNIFIKSDVVLPHLDPMMESASYCFNTLLFGKGVAPSRFLYLKNVKVKRFKPLHKNNALIKAVLNHEEEVFLETHPSLKKQTYEEAQNHLLLISKTIEGINGDEFFEKKENYKQLDKVSFDQHFIFNFLLHPGDYKPANLIIQNKQLVSIDMDSVCHHIKKNYSEDLGFSSLQPFGGCKSIIFLLEELLLQPVSTPVIQRIIEVDAKDLLKNWIMLLERQNQKIDSFFEKESLSVVKRYKKNHLPLKIERGVVKDLYEDFIALQKLFKESSEKISWKKVMDSSHVNFFNYYSHMLHEYKDPVKALKKIYLSERPYTSLKDRNEKIGLEALKGRWMFDSLKRYKERRTITCQCAYNEVEVGIMDKNTTCQKMDWKEVFLKNCDDPFFRRNIAKQIIIDIEKGELPAHFKLQYPYTFLLGCVSQSHNKILKNDLLKDFFLEKSVYEDYIDAYFDNNPKDFSKTIFQICEKIQTRELAICE